MEWCLILCLTFSRCFEHEDIPEVDRSKARSSTGATNAHIYEVACTMVGGETNLKRAISRGAVMIHREGGVDLYSFPSRTTKQTDKVERRVVSEAVSQVGEKQHQDMKDCWGEAIKHIKSKKSVL